MMVRRLVLGAMVASASAACSNSFEDAFAGGDPLEDGATDVPSDADTSPDGDPGDTDGDAVTDVPVDGDDPDGADGGDGVDVAPGCGDGVVDEGEACDGPTGPSCASLDLGFGVTACTDSCELDTRPCGRFETCGDGLAEGTEECDDGNVADGDGCSSACTLEECDPEADTDDDGINDCDDVEECDGIDNDGDGVIDDGVTDASIGESCYTGPEGTEGVGICAPGAIACRGGALVCVGDVTPQFDELCNDLDDDCDGAVPAAELEQGCSTVVVVTPEPFHARFEVRTPPRAVDVALNVDTTGSMGGELANIRTGLRDIIVPGVASVLPDAAFSLSTFDDFPMTGFGDDGDVPFALRQRVTTSVTAVQAALDAAPVNGGGDTPESGIESLYQIATGGGVVWPLSVGVTDSSASGFAAALTPSEIADVDDYVIALTAGETLDVQIFSSRLSGGGFDTYLRLYDATPGTFALLDSNDDSVGLDSVLNWTAEADGDYLIRVGACCSSAPDWGSGEGVYALEVKVDGVLALPAAGVCGVVDTGEDVALEQPNSTATATPLTVGATPDADCATDCVDAFGTDLADEDRASLCPLDDGGTCGNAILELGEECDDGNLEPGDGCDPECVLELASVLPFNWRTGFSASSGNGRIGGVGFREGAVPIIIHVTDAESHEGADYQADFPTTTAHSGEETFAALDDIGARVIGIASAGAALGGIGDPPDYRYIDAMAAATGSTVPLCAFDSSAARTSGACLADQCCTGIDGAGVAPLEDGSCLMVFSVSGTGAGLSDAVVAGIQSVANFGGEQIGARLVSPPGMPVGLECLISELTVSDIIRPGDCLPSLELLDLDGDGLDETLSNATPSTRAVFSFTVVNADTRDVDGDGDTTEACVEPGSYQLSFQLVDADGDVVFAQRVDVVVPDL